MNYLELKAKHRKVIDDSPIRFAFSNKQLDEILEEWKVETKDICSIGMGGYIRKENAEDFMKQMIDHMKESEAAMLDDEFLIDALYYELGNHEFGYTGDPTDAIEAISLDPKGLTEREMNCLTQAMEKFREENYDY